MFLSETKETTSALLPVMDDVIVLISSLICVSIGLIDKLRSAARQVLCTTVQFIHSIVQLPDGKLERPGIAVKRVHIQLQDPLQTRTLQGFESSCPLLKKDFGKNYCPCPLLKKQLPQKCSSCLLLKK